MAMGWLHAMMRLLDGRLAPSIDLDNVKVRVLNNTSVEQLNGEKEKQSVRLAL
jgi:hypothetical protein